MGLFTFDVQVDPGVQVAQTLIGVTTQVGTSVFGVCLADVQ